MELVQANWVNTLVELDMGTSTESFGRFLDSQRELFHSQIDELQKIVVTQCKLTGVNPLSQEMAAGALSIKIGKRPRDLLNPKAIKYMQSVFSIKDTIGKKETREISALCGVTITQVREFFASQRSRVRKLVWLSHEKAIRSKECKASSNEFSTRSDPAMLDSRQAPMNSVEIMTVEECTQVPVNSGHLNTVQEDKQGPVDLVDPKTGGEGPSFSLQEETIPGVDSVDKKFVENIYSLMRREETFSGQVNLMEWILQIDKSAILHWFLTKGGLMILTTWLSQAALEEQTTVLVVIFKVLCHLPLHKALPVQMSAILQTVNRLRFYKTSDISNRARVLLSRWSKLFVRSQVLKRPSSVISPRDGQKEIIRKQRISEILSDESWQSKFDIPEEILALGNEGSESSRKFDPKRALELLPSSCDESNKKHMRNVLSLKTRQRRKVLLVEQPDRKTTGRNVAISRAVPANHSRPTSADDIQKAKIRAIFMQNKYGKIVASSNDNHPEKTNDKKISSAFQTSNILPTSKLPQLKSDEDKKPVAPCTETTNAVLETLINSKPSSTSQEPLWKKLKSNHIPWQTPPEMRTNCLWRVDTGGNSKEVEVQTERIRRERETFYLNVHDIPSNPKEPWDVEMDFDDSLTPDIPTEQIPEADSADGGEVSLISPCNNKDNAEDEPVTTSAPPITNTTPEPDLELLAVLLKNPDLVFALTSGQGNSLTSAETVALLDMLKKSGTGSTGILNGLAGNLREKSEPTSLPSPTPTSDSTRIPFGKNPPLQPHLRDSKDAAASPTASPTAWPTVALPNPSPLPILSSGKNPALSLVSPEALTTILSMPQLTVTINPSSQHHPVSNLLPNKALPLPHQVSTPISPLQQIRNPEAVLLAKHSPVSSVPTVSTSLWQIASDLNHNPIPLLAVPSVKKPILPTPPRPQPPLLSDPPALPTLPPRWQFGAASVMQDPMPNSWNSRANGLLGTPSLNYRFPANQNNYNPFPAGPPGALPVLPGRMAERTGILDGSELETWSPERSPSVSPQFRSIRNLTEPRRDHGWNNRPEWYRQHNSGLRDLHRSGRRWRVRARR